jgi:hypothetical protein
MAKIHDQFETVLIQLSIPNPLRAQAAFSDFAGSTRLAQTPAFLHWSSKARPSHTQRIKLNNLPLIRFF